VVFQQRQTITYHWQAYIVRSSRSTNHALLMSVSQRYDNRRVLRKPLRTAHDNQLGGSRMSTIKVTIKDVYGEQKVYPSCDDAQRFANIAGTKTLTPTSIEMIKLLGYDIDIVHPSI
jgi:hypothetical protein